MEIIHEYDENLPAIFPGGLSIPMQPIPQQQFTEINRVLIIGQVLRNVKLPSGKILIFIRTYDQSFGEIVHRIVARDPIDEYHKVCIRGFLQTSSFKTWNGALRSTTTVRSTNISIIHRAHADINSVELTGTVSTSLYITDNYVLFNVGTKYLNRTKGHERIFYHSVVVADPDLREIVCGALKRGERVTIMGHLGYDAIPDEHGKSVLYGFILATNVSIHTPFMQRNTFHIYE